jgi:hypothetical protein
MAAENPPSALPLRLKRGSSISLTTCQPALLGQGSASCWAAMGWAATGEPPRVMLQKGIAASTAASGPNTDAKSFTRPALAITAHHGGIPEHQGRLGLMEGAVIDGLGRDWRMNQHPRCQPLHLAAGKLASAQANNIEQLPRLP